MTARNVAAIIGDIFTQVMSGQSSREMIFKMWPIAGEVVEEEKVMTREERRNEINALLMKDLYLIMEGRNRKMAAEQMTARNVAAIIGDVFTQVMSGQSSREMIFKMWPIAGEVVEEEKVMTREERRALLLRHNKIINKA